MFIEGLVEVSSKEQRFVLRGVGSVSWFPPARRLFLMPMQAPKHRPLFTAPHASDDAVRGSRHQRGYDKQHDSWRISILRSHPCCRRCELTNRVSGSKIAHHLIEITLRPDLRLHPDNGVGVCETCHAAIHASRGATEQFARDMQSKGFGVKQ
jgi:hypothetical protein